MSLEMLFPKMSSEPFATTESGRPGKRLLRTLLTLERSLDSKQSALWRVQDALKVEPTPKYPFTMHSLIPSWLRNSTENVDRTARLS